MNKKDIKREENEDSPIPPPRQQLTQMDKQYKYEEYCDPFLKLDVEDNVKNSQSSATRAALVSFPPPDTILLTQSSYYSQLDSDMLQAILKAIHAILKSRGLSTSLDCHSAYNSARSQDATMPATESQAQLHSESTTTRLKVEDNNYALLQCDQNIKLENPVFQPVNSVKSESTDVEHSRTRGRLVAKKEMIEEIKFHSKEEAMQLSDLSVRSRLEEAGATPFPIQVDPNILHHSFTRNQLSPLIGGNPQMNLCSVDWNKWKDIHGIPLFVCPTREWNPNLPSKQGYRGIYLLADPHTVNDPIPHLDEPFPLFVKLSQRADSWTYMGRYRYIRTRHLSIQEFAELPALAKAKRLQGYLDLWWGEELRMRLQAQLNKQNVTVHDVEDAIMQGTETIEVAVLNCVGYDLEFHNTLIKKSRLSKSALASLHDKIRRSATQKPKKESPEGDGEHDEPQIKWLNEDENDSFSSLNDVGSSRKRPRI